MSNWSSREPYMRKRQRCESSQVEIKEIKNRESCANDVPSGASM